MQALFPSFRMLRVLGLAGLAFAAATVGCGDVTTTPTGTTTSTGSTGSAPPASPTVSSAKTGDEFPYGVENISWDNQGTNMDVEKWPVNAKISSASHKGESLVIMNNCSDVWKHVQKEGWTKPSVGNYWIIGKVNGQWHGATVDWVGVGRNGMSDLKLDGNAGMYSDLTNWRPATGEEAYVMISTHARAYVDDSNKYRTQIVKITINH
jgi:hypothetical protein